MRKNIRFLAFLFAVVFLFSSCGDAGNNSNENKISGDVSISAEDVSSELLVSEDSKASQGSDESKSDENSDGSKGDESSAESKSDESSVESKGDESSAESKVDEVSEETGNSSEDDVSFEDGEFFILYTEDEVDFSKAPKAEISYYPWNNNYTPYAYGQVIFKKDDGFYVFMYCEEKNPKTEITEIGGNVYLDSALEFFCDYRPEKQKWGERNYINLEMNSAGVYLANYGQYSVLRLSKNRIRVKGEVFDNYWTVKAYIPLGLINDIYGKFEIGEGSVVECNFTKCGSGTRIKHWGTWQPLGGESPNFHQPDYFAEVEIRR